MTAGYGHPAEGATRPAEKTAPVMSIAAVVVRRVIRRDDDDVIHRGQRSRLRDRRKLL